MQVGDPADFILVENLEDFNVSQTFINGTLVYENGKTLIERQDVKTINNFNNHKKLTEFSNYFANSENNPDKHVENAGEPHQELDRQTCARLLKNKIMLYRAGRPDLANSCAYEIRCQQAENGC